MCAGGGGSPKVEVPKPSPLPPPLPAPEAPRKSQQLKPVQLIDPGVKPEIKIGSAKSSSGRSARPRGTQSSLQIGGDNQGLNI